MPQLHYNRAGTRRQGQALLVAVILMMVILLTGILFVTIVSYNQGQSARSVDLTLAGNLASAGIQWCNSNLSNSPLGADWRPPFRAYNPANFIATDRNTWPIPPAVDEVAGAAFGAYGPDGLPDTPDDYYSEFELAHKWNADVDGTSGRYRRYGFYRLPDVNGAPAAAAGSLLSVPDIGAKGHVLVRVTYDPKPPYKSPDLDPNPTPDPMSAYIKIESVGIVDADVPVFRYVVAYKPLALTDYTFFVTDRDGTGRPVRLGFPPHVDMDNDGDIEPTDALLTQLYGPLKFNTSVELSGDNLAPNPKSAGTAGTNVCLTTMPTGAGLEVAAPGGNPQAIGGGYLRNDAFEACGGITEPRAPLTSAVYLRDNSGIGGASDLTPSSAASFDTVGGRVLDGSQLRDGNGFSRFCKPITAPELFPTNGDRYRVLTRDSGAVISAVTPLSAPATTSVNLGSLGFGAGVYVSNNKDLQFVDAAGTHDLDALIADWMQLFPQGQFTGENSGWNATYTRYSAPGVEITFFPTEAAALNFGLLAARTQPASTATPAPSTVWWPNHIAGEPGIRLTRTDANWQYPAGNAPPYAISDSGERALFVDYPSYPNQVIFTEGNARVHGVLPVREWANGAVARDYNLTVVSGGTIYIDGQLLSPQDIFGRDPGDGTGGTAARQTGRAAVSDEDNTRVALLASDCVCLNPTQIVPQLTSGEVAAAADDPNNPQADQQHWELSPEATGEVYSNWMFGEPTGNNVALSVFQSATDPGPAAITMSVYNGQAGTWTPYIFGGSNDFLFVQPGLLTGNNVDNNLAPGWGDLYNPANPLVPWFIRPLIVDSGNAIYPGVLKSFAISHADVPPGLGAGATNYWIKKWKVYEEAGGLPQGSVHAKVNALIYAEHGCWFVIPGDYFAPKATGLGAWYMRRYNYDIAVRGAITENFHADPEMVQVWSDRWAWPNGSNSGWNTIRYEFDEAMRAPRFLLATALSGNARMTATPAAIPPTQAEQANLPKLPLLPVSQDLIFYGEGM